jgi:uncharacterized protein (TIGR03437 family)
MGPRVITSAQDGSYFMSGWVLRSPNFENLAQFPGITGDFQWGSLAIDAPRGVIYGQIPDSTSGSIGGGQGAAPAVPQFMIIDAENLSVRARMLIPENLSGKSILNSARDTMYSLSDSGITIFPVGDFKGVRRIQSNKEQLSFRGSFCDRRVMTQEFTLTDTAGGGTDFRLSTGLAGVRLTPSQGVTPAIIRVQVDPTVYQNRQGTASGAIKIESRDSVNTLSDVRVTINTREPDQRGTVVGVPGKLVDILADPVRNRFYIIRQDTHEVLAFDAANYTQIASFKTGNTPTQLAITQDNRYLLVGHDNAQVATVIDLEAMRRSSPIIFPGGHYPRSIAVSGRAILAAIRVAGDVHVIDRIDFAARRATELPTLGVFKNDVHINTTLVAPPNGSTIFGMMADGRTLLYESASDSFTVARKDFSALAGAYAASNNGSFIVGNRLLNASLVLQKNLDASAGAAAGYAFVDDLALRFTTSGAGNPGTLARISTSTGSAQNATRTVEAGVTEATTPGFAFIRTLAPLSSRQAIVALTQSGFTVIPWNYDALVPMPSLDRVVNAADNTAPVAPGGLISVYGYDLSPVNIATRDVPLPTALADSCLTVNGIVLPLVYVSGNQINAQLPFNVDGRAQMVLRSPAGASNNLNLNIQRAAPSVFRSAEAGPIVLRDGAVVSEENPARPGDALVIYATGLGVTTPSVEAGDPGPSEPLAEAVLRPEISLDGDALQVDYAGLAPGQVGVYQLNVRISGSVKSGAKSLRIRQGDAETTLQLPVLE